MYKKTLIAVALLSASSAAFSATWQNDNVTEVKHTDEGIEGMAVGVGVVTVPALIKLGAEYQVNDEITFTYNQAKAANSPFPSSLYSNKYSGTQIAANAFFMKADAAAGLTSFVLQQTGDAAGSDLTPIGTMITFEGQTTTHYISALSKSTNDITVTISPGLSGIVTAGKDVLIHTSSKFTMNLLSATSTSATYRVAATPNGSNATTTIGTLINTPSVNVTPAGLIAGDATVSFSAKTAGGSAMDALATAVTIAKALPTFTQTITKYDGIIDVEQGRLAFKGGNASSSSDVLTIGTVTQAGVAGNGVAMSNQNVPDVTTAATAVSTTQVSTLHTVDGDWNWMDTSASTAGVQTTGLTGSISPVLNAAGTAVTITATGDVPATTTLTVAKTTATKAVVIPVQGFSGKTVYNYTSGTAKSKTVTHSNLGQFSLNGAVVTAYGVPMGSTVSRFLWVNNKGAISATMSATVTSGGTAYGPYVVGTAAAHSSMSMSAAIDTALTTAGVTLADASRANILFTSPVKAADLTISAAYKHIADADRLTIETSDTIVGAITCTGTTSANAFTGAQVGGGVAITSQGSAAGTATDACSNAK